MTFVEPDGMTRTVEGPAGTSLMQLAITHGVNGIVGECGGQLVCATCHVHVDAKWADRFAAATPLERELLGFTSAQARPDSRLACQLVLSEQSDGCVVEVAASQ